MSVLKLNQANLLLALAKPNPNLIKKTQINKNQPIIEALTGIIGKSFNQYIRAFQTYSFSPEGVHYCVL
jgi:hypothetical protein